MYASYVIFVVGVLNNSSTLRVCSQELILSYCGMLKLPSDMVYLVYIEVGRREQQTFSRTARGRHTRERKNSSVPYETKPTPEELDARHRHFRAYNDVYYYYYERTELLIDDNGTNRTQKIVRRRRPIISVKTTVRAVLFLPW